MTRHKEFFTSAGSLATSARYPHRNNEWRMWNQKTDSIRTAGGHAVMKQSTTVKLIFYPDRRKVRTAIKNDDPLLMLVSHAGDKAIIANIDDSAEHHVLLRQTGHSESDIDKYFRIVVNRATADWTFVCPTSYRNIKDRRTRIDRFYQDGMMRITKALDLINYAVPIDIPVRYRRHFKELADDGR
jgi:hypothetical protein